ncbi:Porin subfamily protein [Flavobacterium fluvii]|uniref:Porin subfamily protein n=1 Tax=Flavobacterium fluvii TaxID=468056 RepID=A0A1M5DYI2_9FLAO|nr:DcaP family trimeric outer membrane transporter [Flavobacterium fluvii]SHF72043.1 Porin subfamily protein [Flavobacterium fluvii]
MIKTRYASLIILLFSFSLTAQNTEADKTMEIFGFIMMDSGYDFGRINPDWYDTMRPTQILDKDGNEYQSQGAFFMSVRQTTFGIKNYLDTPMGQIKTHFEFDLFGMGKEAGNTAFRLKHAYAELGKFGAGQTNSLYTDTDVYPNIVEFMGPNALPFLRNVQVRYTPISNQNHSLAIAIERPGATADQGQYGKDFTYTTLLDNIKPRFSVPDLTAEYRYSSTWGYLELAGIVRSMKWEDHNTDQYDLTGSAVGWGLSLSTRLKVCEKIIFHGAFTTGAGIQNYMNDADADVGIKRQYDNPKAPIKGVAIPMVGVVTYFDINWSEKLSSAIGYSILNNTTTEAQLSTAYKKGQYASVNLLYSPVKDCILGPELQWGMRDNNDFGGDPQFNLPAAKGNSGNDVKIQFSFRYSFNNAFYKNKYPS